MKFLEIFRFEFAYQLRRPVVWLYFAFMGVVAYLFIWGNFIDDARTLDTFVNSPIIIANVTVFSGLFWLFGAASVAGDAAARDAETRMFSLVYTSPISKFEYLAGRFTAAFVINALILFAVPVGIMVAVYSGGIEPEILGPFRPEAYVSAYFYLALPYAFVATAIQFSLAALARQSIVSYLASMLLYVTTYVVAAGVAAFVDLELGKLLNPLASDLSPEWTPIEMNSRLIELKGALLANRLFWIGIALSVLAFTYFRFRLGHPITGKLWSSIKRRKDALFTKNVGDSNNVETNTVSVPQVARTFGFSTRLRQTLAITWESFRTIAKSKSGLVPLIFIAFFSVIVIPLNMEFMDVPFFPRTEYVITFLTAPLTNTQTPWVIIPLLIIFWSGTLIWREREAGISEIANAAPVPEWILVLGKFLGLALMLVVWMTLLAIAGMLVQSSMDYPNIEIGLYLKTLFGLQLPEYLLFACLAFALHILVNQKHLGYGAGMAAYGFIAFASVLGVEHHLLVYGSSPNWTYTDMRGFGDSLTPWLWFKFYWAAWALLLAVFARLFWVRSREANFQARLQAAQKRLSNSTAGIGAAALALILLTGGFIFYNTNILNEYQTASKTLERRAEYERRYGQYKNLPQPRVNQTDLRVEIYPDKNAADVRGTYRLVNKTDAPINTLHIATASEVQTGEITFDRPATLTLSDDELDHRIYALNEPLQPGDSLNLNFEVRYQSQGFRNSKAGFNYVSANGSYLKNLGWFPAVGYQPEREINDAGSRRLYNLAARPEVPTLDDEQAHGIPADGDRINFQAVVGTSETQIAVAPGTLRRAWSENNRRYFEYVANAPIRNEYSFFSADYAVREGRWNDVAVQIYYHPSHTENVERMFQSVQKSLDYYTKHFGAYPNDYLRFVERSSEGNGMHSDSTTIDFSEASSRFDPANDPRGFDFVSAVVAHEIGHQWWGGRQLTPAYVEGAPLLTESLAWYSALGVMNEGFGGEQPLLKYMRATYETPRTRAAPPLLRASSDWFVAYRKGPLALYALSKYIGTERVNLALRRLLEKHGTGEPPLPTSLDLYRELQAVTPKSHQYLLRDLFETNTFWELKTERATVRQIKADSWQVTLDIEARKVVVDEKGVETEMPMNDWVEIGVFAPAEEDKKEGKLLSLQMHRLSSGKQTITVTVPTKPDRAGIDPRFLLIDLKTDNNVRKIKIE